MRFGSNRIIFNVIIYLLFSIEIVYLLENIGICPFENMVKEIDITILKESEGNYKYELEENYVDMTDLFQLAHISGWLVRNEESTYTKISADIVIMSDKLAYRIDSYNTQRTDAYYIDQSNPIKDAIYIGFLSRFPTKDMEKGEYMVGLIVEEDQEQSIFWTDEIILIR